MATASGNTFSFAPTSTITLTDPTTGSALTSVTVGQTIRLIISFGSHYPTFAPMLSSCTIDGISVLTAGCATTTYMPTPTESGGDLTVDFDMIRSTATLSTATSVTISFTITVCDGACTTPSICATGVDTTNPAWGRKKRGADDEETTPLKTINVEKILEVYPHGFDIAMLEAGRMKSGLEGDVCLGRTPFVLLLAGMTLGMLVCLLVTTWVVCFLRKTAGKDSQLYSVKA